MGASILMGNMFGAKEYDKLHRQISTTMLSGIVFFSCIVYSLHLICLPNPDLNAGGFRDHSYDKTLFKDYFFWAYLYIYV